MFPPGLFGVPGGSGLTVILCRTALVAARRRSLLHDSHASRTPSVAGMSPRTVADPARQS
jgi:hypothetical protein